MTRNLTWPDRNILYYRNKLIKQNTKPHADDSSYWIEETVDLNQRNACMHILSTNQGSGGYSTASIGHTWQDHVGTKLWCRRTTRAAGLERNLMDEMRAAGGARPVQ